MDSDVRFTADIPGWYDRVLAPFWFAPSAREMAARVAALQPRRVLEIACGTGILSGQLRHTLPDATALTATDLNAPMIEYARSKVATLVSHGAKPTEYVCRSPIERSMQ